MSATVAQSPEGRSAGTAAALARREQAIAVSGWGAPFRLLQPRNACLWVFAALVASGLLYVVTSVGATNGAFNEAYAVGVVSTGLFAAAFLAFLHYADRFERTPARLAVTAFLGGGFGATFAISIHGNGAVGSLYEKAFGAVWAKDWNAALSAPFVEESAKAIIFLLLLGLAPRVIRTASDGLIVGAYVGLGFQIIEDMFYAQNAAFAQFGAHQSEAVLHVFTVRAVTGITSHAMYAALVCAGLVYLIGTRAQPRRAGRGLALVLAGVLVHLFWDATTAIAGPAVGVVIAVVTTVSSLLVLRIAIRWAGAREREFMHDILAPEVENGTITQAEYDALVGHREDRKAAVKTRGDDMSRRREKHVLRAARDLVKELAQAGGRETPEVAHARAEIARLRGGAPPMVPTPAAA